MDRRMIPLDSIRIDGGTQIRVEINTAVVDEYAEAIDALPPITVYFDGSHHWLADGFHRYHAARKAGRPAIEADLRRGTVDDARWYAVSANKKHGLRRTNQDKCNAVIEAIKMRPSQSDGAIAEHVGVTQPFVSKLRARLTQNGYESPHRIGRDGRTIDITSIGRQPVAATVESASDQAQTKATVTEPDAADGQRPQPPNPSQPRSSNPLDGYPTIKALLKRLYDLSCYRDEQLSALAIREIAKQLTLELTKVL